jgi:ABC-type dipeptide/oligopeptide/nickel transport system ATPase component
MRNGVVVEQGTVDDVLNHGQHPYTQTLIDAYRGVARPLISAPTMREPAALEEAV